MTRLVENLGRLGHKVIVMCPYDDAPNVYAGARVVKLPSFTPLDYSESKLSYPFPLFTFIKTMWEFQPDVLHMVGPDFVTLFLMVGAKIFGVPVIGSYHFYVDAWIKSQPPVIRPFFQWMSWLEVS